jgi:hypothetical protein
MTIQYKNAGINLTTTNTVDILTSPASARCLIKQIQLSNGSAVGALAVVTQVTDSSASTTYRISNQSIAASATTDIITKTLVLEESDVLKMTCSTKDEIQGIVSYAQIDRSQENG